MKEPQTGPSCGDQRVVRGRRGEEAARVLLERRGYQIVDVNVRFGKRSGLRGELDIIAWDGQTLCFVEVKARRQGWGDIAPAAAVTPAKQTQIARLAVAYAIRYGLNDGIPLRFDVVAVLLGRDGETIVRADLIQGAFLARSG